MLNLILFGPPGAGKGTQSTRIAKKYNLTHLSTGDIFRYNIKNETELGKLAKSYIDKGELVPDEVTISMLESEVSKQDNPAGFIFDGFPRTISQAEALDSFLSAHNTSVSQMIALQVPAEELKTRMLHRANVSGRSDDANPEVIRNRIEVYEKETAPIADYYSNKNLFTAIDGTGNIEEITRSLCQEIDKLRVIG